MDLKIDELEKELTGKLMYIGMGCNTCHHVLRRKLTEEIDPDGKLAPTVLLVALLTEANAVINDNDFEEPDYFDLHGIEL